MSERVHRILIVDDQNGFPQTGSLVKCLSEPQKVHEIDVSKYDCVFVHRRPIWLEDWAVEHFDNVFFLSGETERVGQIEDGVFSVGRIHLKAHFPLFEKEYGKLESGIPSNSLALFEGVVSDVAPAIDPIIQVRYQGGKSLPVPIYRMKDGSLDSERILEEMDDLYPFMSVQIPIHLDEEHPYEGIDLVMDLRLRADLDVSRAVVRLLGSEATEDVLKSSINRALIFQSTLGPEDDGCGISSVHDHLRLVTQLTFEEPEGRHKLANLWGPIRLWEGWMMLSPRSSALKLFADWPVALLERIRRHRYYAKQLAIAHLLRGEESREASLEVHERWLSFLDRMYSERPMNLLLIDDEAEGGWVHAIEALFVDRPGSVQLHAPSIQDVLESKVVASSLESDPPDIILCDLRLFEKEDESIGRDQDLSGHHLIRGIKQKHPGIPIIAFTASNKVWSAEAALSDGADGYWVKENPSLGIDEEYSIQNATRLVSEIEKSISTREKAAPVQELRGVLERLVETQRGEVYTPHHAALERVKRCYWQLIRRESRHERSFGINRLDIAFLELWSVINEVSELCFQIPTASLFKSTIGVPREMRDFHVLTPDGWKCYIKAISDSEGEPQETIIQVRSDYRKRKLAPLENDLVVLKQAANASQTERIKWLVSMRSSRLEQSFHKYRELRNNLSLEHGDHSSERQATIEDIRGLCKIWCTLFKELS